MVQGVTATLQKGTLSLHFKCDSSLHCHLLSSLFLFNNVITSPDLIFLPQKSLQRFMPMNIHPLLKSWELFSQGRCSSAAGSEVCLPHPSDSERGKAPAPSQEERGSQPWAPCSQNLPFLSISCSISVKGRGAWAAQQLLRTGMGVVATWGGGKRFLQYMHTALHSYSLRSCGLMLGLINRLSPVAQCLHHLHIMDGWHHEYLTLEFQAPWKEVALGHLCWNSLVYSH